MLRQNSVWLFFCKSCPTHNDKEYYKPENYTYDLNFFSEVTTGFLNSNYFPEIQLINSTHITHYIMSSPYGSLYSWNQKLHFCEVRQIPIQLLQYKITHFTTKYK